MKTAAAPLKNPHYLPASNGWDRIDNRLTSGRYILSPLVVWGFALYGAIEFVRNVLIPLIQAMVQ